MVPKTCLLMNLGLFLYLAICGRDSNLERFGESWWHHSLIWSLQSDKKPRGTYPWRLSSWESQPGSLAPSTCATSISIRYIVMRDRQYLDSLKPDREARTCGSPGRRGRIRRTIPCQGRLRRKSTKNDPWMRWEQYEIGFNMRWKSNQTEFVFTCHRGRLQTAEVLQAALRLRFKRVKTATT